MRSIRIRGHALRIGNLFSDIRRHVSSLLVASHSHPSWVKALCPGLVLKIHGESSSEYQVMLYWSKSPAKRRVALLRARERDGKTHAFSWFIILQGLKRQYRQRPWSHCGKPLESVGKPFQNRRWPMIAKAIGCLDTVEVSFALTEATLSFGQRLHTLRYISPVAPPALPIELNRGGVIRLSDLGR